MGATATLLQLLVVLLVMTTCDQVYVSAASSTMAPASAATAPTEPDQDEGVLYMVGQPVGWFIIPGCGNLDFQAWAESTTFHPGDTLYFHYPNNNDSNVIQVSREDYDTCTITSPLAMYTSGEDYIKLREEGDLYFVSGAHNYCQYQKIHVRVVPRITSALPPHSSSSSSVSSAPASHAHHHTSSATSITRPQRMSTWVMLLFGLSLALFSYV